MKPDEYDILALIPQRPPMVLIDQLDYADEKSAGGRLIVKESNLFCTEGCLQEAGLIEFIAQTAAASAGYKQLSVDREVAPGFIGAIKNLVIHSLPEINSEIRSEVTIESELLGFTIITGKIMHNNSVIAECEMRILVGNPDLR